MLDAQLRAQAGVWLARLRSEDRTHADEAGFQDWLEEDPRHRAAFEAATLAWEAVGALHIQRAQQGQARRRALARRATRRMVIGGGAALAAGTVGVAVSSLLAGWTSYATAVGEMRTIALSDGSRLILDTDSAVRTNMDRGRRSIELVRGRAHFAVAKDPMRPFVVSAGVREVVAVGTAFDVSRSREGSTVLLLEGRVVVQKRRGFNLQRLADMAAPGVRLTMYDDGRIGEDRPDVARLTAWQTGRLIFDHDSLDYAVTEMNRYNHRQIVLGSDALKGLRFSGVYVSGDPHAFATSVAALFDLAVREEEARTILEPTSATPLDQS